MLTTTEMLAKATSNDAPLSEVIAALAMASAEIFAHVKNNDGMAAISSTNQSGDTQIGLDVIADNTFREQLAKIQSVSYVVTEEQPSLVRLGGHVYSVALDPLDGSKSARVGIPCGSIFAIFRNISTKEDFSGKNVVASGFFVYGTRHELFVACNGKLSRFREDDQRGTWNPAEIPAKLPEAKMLSINASNFGYWAAWMKRFYSEQFDTSNPMRKPSNMRWYASLVSDVKRLIIEGGMFAYPGDMRAGYEHGQLRLVYEAIPMAYVMATIGGRATDGKTDILSLAVVDLHQKTPLFMGHDKQINALHEFSAAV